MSENAMLKIDEIIEEIESYIASAGRVPLTNKVMVKDDDLFHMMDKLRQELPKEVADSVDICRRRDEIIGDAQATAEEIVAKATSEAESIVAKATHEADVTTTNADRYAERRMDENSLQQQAAQQAREMVEQAEAHVKQIRDEADAYAQQIREEAVQYAQQLREGAENYANQYVDGVLGVINETMTRMNDSMDVLNNNVVNAMKNLNAAKEQIHQANNPEN